MRSSFDRSVRPRLGWPGKPAACRKRSTINFCRLRHAATETGHRSSLERKAACLPIRSPPGRLVRRGDKIFPVRPLQQLLRARNHPVAVDGIFGPNTETAVKSFQQSRGLAADGLVGPQTWPKLVVQIKKGSTGDARTRAPGGDEVPRPVERRDGRQHGRPGDPPPRRAQPRASLPGPCPSIRRPIIARRYRDFPTPPQAVVHLQELARREIRRRSRDAIPAPMPAAVRSTHARAIAFSRVPLAAPSERSPMRSCSTRPTTRRSCFHA